MQPNNEKPQAKQLQSRCDTILKILSKSHKYSSVADSVSTSKVKNKSRKSKEAKHITVTNPNKRVSFYLLRMLFDFFQVI